MTKINVEFFQLQTQYEVKLVFDYILVSQGICIFLTWPYFLRVRSESRITKKVKVPQSGSRIHLSGSTTLVMLVTIQDIAVSQWQEYIYCINNIAENKVSSFGFKAQAR